MKITIFQRSHIKPKDPQFSAFCKKFPKQTLIVLGEYVLNPFFHTLVTLSSKQIIQHSIAQINYLEQLAKKHSISFFAPIIMGESTRLIKQLVFIDGTTKSEPLFYTQQKLIGYEHWNEAGFFANPKVKNFKDPFLFRYCGFTIAGLFGFEIHFDELWLKLKKAGVDMVLLPTANTFGSYERWRELCKMRAFLNGCMIVRANRVGKLAIENQEWEFYGDSLIAMPNGEIIDWLGEGEEILSLEIEKEEITKIALEWGFRQKYTP